MIKSKRISVMVASFFLAISGVSGTTAMKEHKGTLPLKNFITRDGDKLMAGDQEFRFFALASSNLHQNEEQLLPDYSNRFPDEYEIRDTLTSIRQMGGTATRCFTLSIRKKGQEEIPVYIEGPGDYNESAFRTLDKVLQLCNELDVRLILPFIDSHSFWGWRGVKEFAAFRDKDGNVFWSDPQLKEDFKNLIQDVLNRKNVYTGVLYKDDPAILAWQLGNELDSYIYDNQLADREAFWKEQITHWSQEMAAHIKSLDHNHLVMEGGGDMAKFLGDPHIDIISRHYYVYWNAWAGRSTDLADLNRKDKQQTKAAGKVLIADEFGMGDTEVLVKFMDEVIRNGTSGALLWGIRSHRRDGGFFFHGESGGYASYHWPGFASADNIDEKNLLHTLRQKAYQIRGLPEPPLPVPTPTPHLLPIHSVDDILWRGSTGAAVYDIERAETPKGPWKIVGKGIEDAVPDRRLFGNITAPKGKTYYYRIKGRNISGETDYSNIQESAMTVHMQPLKEKALEEVRNNILSFWMENTVDTANGGFYGQIAPDNTPDREANKGIVLNARILWTFSAAYRVLQDEKYLKIAQRAYDYLTHYFLDKKYGGYYYELDSMGEPVDPRKVIYCQAFALYGLSEYYRVTLDEDVLKQALDLYRLMKQHALDTEYQGYFENFTRQWKLMRSAWTDSSLARDKSLNTHLHIIEAYTCLYLVWPDDTLKKDITAMLDYLFLEKMIDPDAGHFRDFFSRDWQALRDDMSWGHDIEASWLLLETAHILGDESLIKKCEELALKIADFTYQGISPQGGLWNEELSLSRNVPYSWWPQSEGVIGYLNAWQISHNQKYLDTANLIWNFIDRYFIDHQYGEWINSLDENLTPRPFAKVGFWKAPYHNTRMCLEIITRADDMLSPPAK
ncbi:MAG: AGE family epimerase/isomerase [Sedimentisphaerales bacterium]|nr:AGE family epimerase/isomerase [Sedimentisphaerales bacterium]